MPPLKISKFMTEMSISRNNNYFTPLTTNAQANEVYTCNNHAPKILNNLNGLRQNSRFCDVEIVAGSKVFKAHRAVLAASSPYFQAMFAGGLCEQDQNSVQLHSMSPNVFDYLLSFIYSGRIDISEGNVQEIMVAADMLELSDVVDGCSEFLLQEMRPFNVVGIYRFAEAHNFTDLALSSLQFIQSHFPQVSKEEELYDLPKDLVTNFLKSEHLRVDSELQVFQAAIRWITRDITNRKRFVFEILQHVRLPLLPLMSLEKAMSECSDSSLNVALKSIYNDLVNRRGCLVSLTAKPRLCAKKDIFVIGGSKREIKAVWDGGLDFNYVTPERFDTFTREWTKMPCTNQNRIVPGVAALHGLIYVIGGEQESTILSSGECYDPEKEQWQMIADMLRPRCEFGLCALDGHLYALGGWMGGSIGAQMERYDPRRGVWEEIGMLPESRFSMGVVAYEGLIYMVGGCSETIRFLQDFWCYNPVTRQWRSLTPMPCPRSQMGVVIIDQHLYVVGGTCRDQVLNSVERYSFKKNKWTPVTPMRAHRSGPAAATIDGILYVIGGLQPHTTPFYRAQTTICSVECYDPATGVWSDCPPLSESRAEAGAVVI